MHNYNVCLMCILKQYTFAAYLTIPLFLENDFPNWKHKLQLQLLSLLGPITRVQMVGQLWKVLPIYILMKHSLMDLD